MRKKIVHVHVPFPMLVARLDEVIKAGINPELYLSGEHLDYVKPGEIERLAKGLSNAGLRCTIHGPFRDLSPGAADEKIRRVTEERYLRLLEVVAPLKPRAVVLHAGYDEQRFDGDAALWLGQSLKTWPSVIAAAEKIGTVIAVENVYEERPDTHRMLFDEIGSPALGACIDSGHLNVFSKVPSSEWFSSIGERVVELHIHDNRGERDEHMAIGDGEIDFDEFFGLVAKHSNDPIFTIEPHGEEVLQRGLKALEPYLG